VPEPNATPAVPEDELARAVAILERGGLVAFPTETVYGLGADAESPAAVRRLFAAKGRPVGHPVIVHLADAAWLPRYASRVSPAAEALAARFWPGPLTLILPRSARVPLEVTGGQETVGLRMPDHPVARALLARFGRGLAAPSANRFGRLSPTRPEHVRAELGPAVDLVLEGGSCRVGVESTIVDLSGERPALLRPGGIGAAEIAEVLGAPIAPAERPTQRAPGTLASHYAPATPLRLVPRGGAAAEAASVAGGAAVLAFAPAPAGLGAAWVEAPSEPDAYARALYATLRDLDALGRLAIIVEEPPATDAWLAVRDRLARAARGSSGAGGHDAPA
jgi:L-threonylcarbamoyladenylate synthase